MRNLLLALLTLSVCSISAQDDAPKEIETSDIKIIAENKPIPEGAIRLRRVEFLDNFDMEDCSKKAVLEAAKKLAIKYGGNAIKINDEYPPGLGHICYEFEGDVLYIEDPYAKLNGTYSPTNKDDLDISDEFKDDGISTTKDYLEKPFRISIMSGIGTHTLEIPEEYPAWRKAYQEKLNRGQLYAISGMYQFGEKTMIGWELNNFRSKNESEPETFTYIDENYNEQTVTQKISDDLSITSFMTSLLYYVPVEALRTNFYGKIKAGTLWYRNHVDFGHTYKLNGFTYIVSAGIGFETQIYKGIFINANLTAPRSYLFNVFYDPDNEDYFSENYDPKLKLGRLDFTVGMSFKFGRDSY